MLIIFHRSPDGNYVCTNGKGATAPEEQEPNISEPNLQFSACQQIGAFQPPFIIFYFRRMLPAVVYRRTKNPIIYKMAKTATGKF